MYENKSGYDRGVSTFSPDGRLHQIEYASKAIELGSCAIGIRTAEGVVLSVEKRITSTLMEKHSVEKIVELDSHVGAAISGLQADARTLVDHARVEAQGHRFMYAEPMRVESLAQSICDLAIAFGEGDDERGEEKKKMSRPFGVSLLVAGHGEEGPRLICVDPSGTHIAYDAHAIGAGQDEARSQLSSKYHRGITLDDALALAVSTLRSTMEERITKDNIELATVTADGGYHVIPEDEVQTLIERAVAEAEEEAAA